MIFRAVGGELQTLLDDEESLSEAQARICMREVLKALHFLHNRSVAHLDLKPQNILLTGQRIEGTCSHTSQDTNHHNKQVN